MWLFSTISNSHDPLLGSVIGFRTHFIEFVSAQPLSPGLGGECRGVGVRLSSPLDSPMLDLPHDLHVILLGHLTAPGDSCGHHHLQTPKWRMGVGLKLGSVQAFLSSLPFSLGNPNITCLPLRGKTPRNVKSGAIFGGDGRDSPLTSCSTG